MPCVFLLTFCIFPATSSVLSPVHVSATVCRMPYQLTWLSAEFALRSISLRPSSVETCRQALPPLLRLVQATFFWVLDLLLRSLTSAVLYLGPVSATVSCAPFPPFRNQEGSVRNHSLVFESCRQATPPFRTEYMAPFFGCLFLSFVPSCRPLFTSLLLSTLCPARPLLPLGIKKRLVRKLSSRLSFKPSYFVFFFHQPFSGPRCRSLNPIVLFLALRNSALAEFDLLATPTLLKVA